MRSMQQSIRSTRQVGSTHEQAEAHHAIEHRATR